MFFRLLLNSLILTTFKLSSLQGTSLVPVTTVPLGRSLAQLSRPGVVLGRMALPPHGIEFVLGLFTSWAGQSTSGAIRWSKDVTAVSREEGTPHSLF